MNKKYLISAIAVIILLGGGFYYLYSRGGTSSLPFFEDTTPPPVPEIKDDSRTFEVISVGGGGDFRVKDISSKEIINMFVPSDAKFDKGSFSAIKEKSVVSVKKSMKVANGILATQLSVTK